MSKIDGGDTGTSKPGSLGSGKDNHANAASAAGKQRGGGSKEERADSMEQAAERISNVTLDTSPFGEKVRPGKGKVAGPSLLSQQAPGDADSSSAGPSAATSPSPSKPPPYSEDMDAGMSNHVGPVAQDPPVSSSAMSVDAPMPNLEGMEKITVKIADLGNGE